VVEIILLAMVAVFVGLRLFSVLGQRTGHEQEPAPRTFERAKPQPAELKPVAELTPEPQPVDNQLVAQTAEPGISRIAQADREFDIDQFAEGAQAAYRMILEAFWKGDKQELSYLVGDEVGISFKQAIDVRVEEGHELDNRLVAIEKVEIVDAELDRQIARITVRFEADIATVTRDKDGEVIAGSLSDAVPTRDVWTFERNLREDDPNWLLVETDEAQ
jgi:predicted lipid-binding transport protein (Tim44 family)